MEGHILSALLEQKGSSISNFQFPVISLLVSGGHTELVLMKKWLDYKIIGETRDDAVGEAFDKVARMLDLGYPGGPQVAKLASLGGSIAKLEIKLPRPMMNSGDLDFSFSGLKTAVLYKIKELSETKKDEIKKSGVRKNDSRRISLNDRSKENYFSDKALNKATTADICHEFQESAVDVLTAKTISAVKKYKAKTIVIGGGVASNTRLRERLKESSVENSVELILPQKELATDNAVMIAMAGYLRILWSKNPDVKTLSKLKAEGNLRLK